MASFGKITAIVQMIPPSKRHMFRCCICGRKESVKYGVMIENKDKNPYPCCNVCTFKHYVRGVDIIDILPEEAVEL